MQRALELAARGLGYTSPNPMVGAVIVHNDTIIGEGYHRLYGQGHAEVNAVASVCDSNRHLLPHSTMYVTLEPCSHWGKTPPCANLIIDHKIPRVVVGALDPFVKVAGRGIAMLREAGIEVIEGVMADESRQLNKTFFTAHTLGRPFITLKWAMSADGYMDHRRSPGEGAYRFSTPITTMLTHRLRAIHDAILTTATTVNADNPMLNVRQWHGRDPRPVIIDRRGIVNPEAAIVARNPIIYNDNTLSLLATDPRRDPIDDNTPLLFRMLRHLFFNHGITSLLVEAGPTLLQSFLDHNVWNEIRVETSTVILGDNGTYPAPLFKGLTPTLTEHHDPNTITWYKKFSSLVV